VRSFPLTAPTERVSLCDEHGHEICCVHDLSDLSPENRSLIERELTRREFLPVLRRILSIEPASEPSRWEVETDRGRTQFTLVSEDHIRRLGPWGALISDADGVRYRVLDSRTLDAHSRKLLKQYI